MLFLWWTLLAVGADETPPGLVNKESDHDLLAQATNSGQQAQKREAALSNSYGEPLPADAYGPPHNIPLVSDSGTPAAVYGPPDQVNIYQQPPPGAYGPPAPVVFPSQNYQGPPPPFSKPKYPRPPMIYGPPKQSYGPPKVYGPPKKTYGPPKQSLPKPVYSIPFKPPKISFPKQMYGPPKSIYGPPKQVYGPPKITYGPPLSVPAIPLEPLPPIPQNVGFSNNIDLGLNLPAPIYGTPLNSLPSDLKPNFPIPSDQYGPPGYIPGPIGPEIQQNIQYGPPQPDPNPRPPHPGIPAPPTPPHVLYDGWKPIPGISSKPVEIEQQINSVGDQYGPPPPPPPQYQEIHINLDGNALPEAEQHHQFSGAQISSGYSSVHADALANIDLNAIVGGDSNHIDQSKTVFEAHYTENHNPQQDLAFIQQAIPVERPLDSYGAPPSESLSNGPYPSSIRQQGAKGLVAPSGIYGVPPGNQYGAPPRPPPAGLPIPYGSYSGGGHSIHTGGSTPRQPIKFRESVPEGLIQSVAHITHHKDHHGTDHLTQGPAYLPPPIRDVKDVNQNLGNHGLNSLSLSIEPSNLYSLPHSGNPINFQSQGHPNNLYGSPVDSYSVPLFTVGDSTGSSSNVNEVKATIDGTVFANLSNLDAAAILKHCPYHEAILRAAQYGEKIPSELASSYVASLSSLGSTLSKNQQVLISPQNGFNTPAQGSESVSYNSKDLGTASNSLVQSIIANDIKHEKTESNSAQKGKSMKDAKNSHKDEKLQFVSDQIFATSEKIKNLSEETKQLQQKIVSTSQNLQQVNGNINNFSEIPVKGKLGSYSLQIQSSESHNGNNPSIPHEQLLSEGLLQSILQAIEQPNGPQKTITHNQINHVGHAPQINQISQSSQFNQISHSSQINKANHGNHPFGQGLINFGSLDEGGLVLPDGYEPIDHTKIKKPQNVQTVSHQQQQIQQSQSIAADQEIQSTNKDIRKILNNEIVYKHRGDIPQTECDLKYAHAHDLRTDDSINHNVVVPPPNVDSTSVDNVESVDEIDMNDVAIFFDEKTEKATEEKEPVTEISVATSISENVDEYNKKPEFGDKIKKQ